MVSRAAILTAMKFDTGEIAWRDRSVGKGSLVYADGHLYCFSENGVVGLVEATPTGYKEKGRFRFSRIRCRRGRIRLSLVDGCTCATRTRFTRTTSARRSRHRSRLTESGRKVSKKQVLSVALTAPALTCSLACLSSRGLRVIRAGPRLPASTARGALRMR